MTRATPDSSQTRLLTVKSRSAEGSDCTFLSFLPFFYLVCALNRGQGANQQRGELVQLTCMVQRERLENLLSFGRQLQKDATAVISVGRALNQASLLASHAQLHDAVVPQSKTLGCIAYCRGCSVGPSGNLQQELVLLRLKIELRRRCFAEVKKQPELMAKLRQYLERGSGV